VSRYRWTPEAIAAAIRVLRQHSNLDAGVSAVCAALGHTVTRNSIDLAFRKAGKGSAASYLRQYPDIPVEVVWDDATEDAPPPATRFNALIEVAKRAAKRGDGLSLEELCNALRLPPSSVLMLVEDARREGVSVDIANDRLHFKAPEAPTCAVPVSPTYNGRDHRVGVFSDLHFGSKYCLREQFTAFVRMAYEAGCRDFFCPGDVVEGYYRHAAFERSCESLDDQQAEFLDALPQLEGMRVFFIDGNHDFTFTERTGIESGRNLVRLARERGREDLTFLGSRGALIQYGDTRIELWHPKKGAAYALSYQLQNHIRDTAPARRPHILLTGHTHQYVKVRQADVFAFYAGTFQHGETPYGKSIGGDTAMGGIILDWRIDDDGIVRSLSDTFCVARHAARTFDVAV
jgi:UDP-2,3-diacylglucosamine pyrophosphatase LpxH